MRVIIVQGSTVPVLGHNLTSTASDCCIDGNKPLAMAPVITLLHRSGHKVACTVLATAQASSANLAEWSQCGFRMAKDVPGNT